MQETDALLLKIQKWMKLSMHYSNSEFIRYARECGLSMSQLGALFHIHHHGSSPVTHLGHDLGVTGSAASQMLDRLVQQELITRSEDPDDRRVKQISLTDRGRQVLQEGINARQSWLVELSRTLSDSDKETITSAFNILIDKAAHLDRPVEFDQ
ncbi:MAG: MarR family transcriptional regulator [Anaerolineales bacterium]|nr:MarR family transcriptional regulator [Anaerolineales bacterium]